MRTASLIASLLLAGLFCGFVQGQTVPRPVDILGYEPGGQFSYHHRVVEYFKAVAAAAPDRVKLIPYGRSLEDRELMVAVVTAPRNMSNLDQIRRNNLIRAHMAPGETNGKELPIVWLSYNIHGNESVSTEAAIACLYELATGKGDAGRWLEDLIVVLDPCVNPDGRERYVNWYRQALGASVNPAPESREHQEPWPGGRFNHYLFDLNRDWCWQSQHESRLRATLYHQWMPQVHVDFHEMGVDESYFFAPSAKPIHFEITPWQREFQELTGANHARYFDANNWLYFTREVFDLFYPSYGDTWPSFQGAIGFTYEQGGSGRAGLAVARTQGDTLTLADRMAHHLSTSLSTIETAWEQRERLRREFDQYFDKAVSNPPGPYKAYVFKKDNPAHGLKALCELFDRQQIRYSFVPQGVAPRKFSGYDYFSRSKSSATFEAGDLWVPAAQPQATLLKVLLEPEPALEDSMTYDITAWALPYVFGLKAYATEENLNVTAEAAPAAPMAPEVEAPFGLLCAWNDVQHARFLGALLQKGITVRGATQTFATGGKSWAAGTLAVLAADNKAGYARSVYALARELNIGLTALSSGRTDSGRDLGADGFQIILAPKIALIGGEGVSPTDYGELWHFVENDLQYPLHTLETRYLHRVSLNDYDVIMLPSGDFSKHRKTLSEYASQGGRIIALEEAISAFASKSESGPNTQLSQDMAASPGDANKTPAASEQRYDNRERSQISSMVAGSIYRVQLDGSHPVAFGLGNHFFLSKRNATLYPLLGANQWTPGRYTEHISGFAGSKVKSRIPGSMALGIEQFGRGELVYMPDSPIFRGFWHSGKLLLSNAIFLR